VPGLKALEWPGEAEPQQGQRIPGNRRSPGPAFISAFCFPLSAFTWWWLWGRIEVALESHWGAYRLAINTLWGGFDVALMSH
jgi:hypothetical protein